MASGTIENISCCSAFCSEMREDVRSRVEVIMFALAIILTAGIIVMQLVYGGDPLNMSQFYLDPAKFMYVVGTTGLCTVGIMAIFDVGVRVYDRTSIPIANKGS